MQKKQLIARMNGFLSNLSKKDRIAIFFHGDTDGICSGALAGIAVKQLVGKKPSFFAMLKNERRDLKKETWKKLLEKKINKIIFVDWSFDQFPDVARKIEKKADVLIVDHHKIYNDLNSERTIMIKSQMVSEKEPSKYPAAKLCYDLFSKRTDLKKWKWLAAAGLIGDNALKEWKPFVTKTKNELKLKNQLTQFNKLVDGIEAAAPQKMVPLVKAIIKSKGIKQILKSSYGNYRKRVEKEVDKWLEKFPYSAEFHDRLNVVFYKIQPRYKIKSIIVNHISKQYFPKKTVLVLMHEKGKVFVSARRQDFKVKMNDLLETATKRMKGSSAGGHIPAAAAIIKKSDLKKFKKNVMHCLESNEFN